MSQLQLDNQSSVPTPSSGATTIYVDSADKLLKSKDDSGAVTNYGSAGVAITSLTGQVTATGPGAATATVANSAVIGKVLTGLAAAAGTIVATDTILQAFGKLVNKQNNAVYPNLAVGATTIATDTTLTQDLYCDTLTVNVGATLYTNGYRVIAKSGIVNNGSIDRSGNNATGTAATAALTAGTLGAAGAGGAGGTAAGSAGGSSATGLGGAGAAGGAGSGGAGGAAGTFTIVPVTAGGPELFYDQGRGRLGLTITGTAVTGGAGGGGGGGDGTAGGAGGGGGALMVLISRSITGTGTIRAKGGNGFQPLAGNRGGGGGGGGGIIITISENDVTAAGLTFDVSGGTGASGSGTGASGSNGSNGRIYNVVA
jgi:hypothetical protein